VHLYVITTYIIDKDILNTLIKGLNGVIERAYNVQKECKGYTVIRMLYVVYLARWDMRLGKLALTVLNGLIPPGLKYITIQPEGILYFTS